MASTISWSLRSENAAELTVNDVVYENVVRVVHWVCTASEDGVSVALRGSHDVPAPVSPETYIPVATIAAMDEATRRTTVLAWAEVVEAGFVARTEAHAAAKLVEKQAEPTTTMMEIVP